MKTITATVPAWITEHRDINELNESSEIAVCAPVYHCRHDMTGAGWTRIGAATITLEIVSADELVQNQVGALEKQMQSVLADAQQKVNYIKDRISKLQALTFEVTP